MQTAVVTGGAGFLGSHLCDKLLSEGLNVICIDNLITGNVDNIAHLAGNEKFSFPARWAMLSTLPVMRLSIQITFNPSLSNLSQRCDPKNPAPPVTTAVCIFIYLSLS